VASLDFQHRPLSECIVPWDPCTQTRHHQFARVAGQAIEVSESHRVGVGERGLRGSNVLNTLVEVNLAKGGGRRDKGGSGRNGGLGVHFLTSKSYTINAEGIKISVGYYWNKREREQKQKVGTYTRR
jgi:hypothetical protein